MRLQFIGLGGLLLVAGCQSAEEKVAAQTGEIRLQEASLEEVSRLTKAARDKNALQPGIWKTDLKIVSADLSAIPEGEARESALQGLKRLERDSESCRTADDLKPFDIEELAAAAGQCTFPRFIQADGKVDVEIICGEGPSRTVMSVKGDMSPSAFDIVTEQATAEPVPGNYKGLTLRATGTRKGSCSAN